MPATATKERPILFSAPMVTALLDGRKTQTRRIVKRQPVRMSSRFIGDKAEWWYWKGGAKLVGLGYGADYVHTQRDAFEAACRACCPYSQIGERLWVKATFMMFERAETMVSNAGGPFRPNGEYIPGGVGYRADLDECGQVPVTDGKLTVWRTPKGPWRPSLFMPRALSRLTLEITDVRVQRVEDINEEDAIAEGMLDREAAKKAGGGHFLTPRLRFLNLFYDINKRAPRDANPWVWALTFKKV